MTAMLRLQQTSLRTSFLFSLKQKSRINASLLNIRYFARQRRETGFIDTQDNVSTGLQQYKPAITANEDTPTDFTIDPITRSEILEAIHEEDVEEEEEEPSEVGKRLLYLSNSYYRRITPFPAWFPGKKKEMTEGRTLAQVRRSLKSWMIRYDINEMKTYLNRPFHYNTNHFKKDKHLEPKPIRTTKYLYGPDETMAYAYYHMPSRYTITVKLFEDLKKYTGKGYTPKKVLDYGCGPATVGAALATVWPEEVKQMSYTGVEISRAMMDAAAIMVQDVIPNATFWTKTSDIISRCLEKNERYDCIVCSYTLSELYNDETRRVAVQMLYELLEPNGYLLLLESGNPLGSHMIRTARQYLLHMGRTVDRKGNFQLYQEELSEEERKKKEQAEEDNEEDDDYDDEEDDMKKGKKKNQDDVSLRKRLKKILKKNDPSESERKLPTLTMILPPPKTYAYDDFQAMTIAPCTHDKECPLKRDQWCSFSQKVISATIRKDSEEKYSYVWMQKVVNPSRESNPNKPSTTIARASWLKEEPADDLSKPLTKDMLINKLRPLQILNRFIDMTERKDERQAVRMLDMMEDVDWEKYSPKLVRNEYARIIRSPLKERGHVIFDLCLPSGETTRYIHSKATLKFFPHLYRGMRKSSWGGIVPAFMPNQEKLRAERVKVIETKKPNKVDAYSMTNLNDFLRKEGEVIDADFDERTQNKPTRRVGGSIFAKKRRSLDDMVDYEDESEGSVIEEERNQVNEKVKVKEIEKVKENEKAKQTVVKKDEFSHLLQALKFNPNSNSNEALFPKSIDSKDDTNNSRERKEIAKNDLKEVEEDPDKDRFGPRRRSSVFKRNDT